MTIVTQAAPTFHSKDFGSSSVSQSMSQEASMLGVKPGVLPYGRLHADSPELGFRMLAENGVETIWIFMHTSTCAGEVQGWRFSPTADTIAKHPYLEGYDLLIIND
jgi:hypothetical protein